MWNWKLDTYTKYNDECIPFQTEMKESHTEEIKKVKQQMNEDMETAVLEGKQEVTEQYEQEMSQMIKSYKAQIEVMSNKTVVVMLHLKEND